VHTSDHEHSAPAAPGQRDLSKEAINALPVRAYSGHVHIVDDPRLLGDAVKSLRRDRVLGFDTETRPAFRRGQFYLPALLQMASRDSVWLFHLRRLEYPNTLWDLLADEKILKVGVSIAYDVKQLLLLSPFEPGGFVDLTALSIPLGYKAAGLRNLAANLLGFRISKGPKTSNWDREPLTEAQVLYAATDAWVGRELYLKLHALERQAALRE
jgi:ribonuclease D